MTEQYYINELGVISNPGKFEGEPLYAPYFWDLALGGLAHEDDGTVYTFVVTESDRAKFPDLKDANNVLLEETESGFVYTVTEWKGDNND